MKNRRIGNTDLEASEVSLGGDTFGQHVDKEGTVAIVHRALDLGINFIDTSDVYGGGKSEEYIGAALKGRRSQVIIATKFGLAVGKGSWLFDEKPGLGSRGHIVTAVEASLKRLGTDYIDLYQFHIPDPVTPVEETLRALDDLVRDGKVRYIGCSNFAAWQLCEALWISKHNSLNSFVTVQSRYNFVERQIEQELVPCCKAYNISIIPWFPLAGGFLTGKYRRGEPLPEGTRIAKNPSIYSSIMTEENFDRLDRMQMVASRHGRTMAELAIAWLLSNPLVCTVIAGVTKIEQLKNNVAAAGWKLTPDELEQMDGR